MRTAESSLEDARATNHATSLGNALAVAACPIALWSGDLTAAERYVDMLLEYSTKHVLGRWHSFGLCYQAILLIQRGDASSGLRLLRTIFAEPATTQSPARLLHSLFQPPRVMREISPTGSPRSERKSFALNSPKKGG
jgi:hypothetical protein